MISLAHSARHYRGVTGVTRVHSELNALSCRFWEVARVVLDDCGTLSLTLSVLPIFLLLSQCWARGGCCHQCSRHIIWNYYRNVNTQILPFERNGRNGDVKWNFRFARFTTLENRAWYTIAAELKSSVILTSKSVMLLFVHCPFFHWFLIQFFCRCLLLDCAYG